MTGTHRQVYTDRRNRRVASGFVVVSTRHPAAGANSPTVHQRFELAQGVLTLRGLPANTYLLHATLRSSDGEEWEESNYFTLEDA